jgi:hypothetical protein
MRFSAKVEFRLAGAVIRLLRHMANKYGREHVMDHVDHRDFADEFLNDLRPMIHHELLEAKLEGLRIAPADREREKRKVMIELARIDDLGPPGAPKF